jgi:hypothetical protein
VRRQGVCFLFPSGFYTIVFTSFEEAVHIDAVGNRINSHQIAELHCKLDARVSAGRGGYRDGEAAGVSWLNTTVLADKVYWSVSAANAPPVPMSPPTIAKIREMHIIFFTSTILL